ncbi:hypothetical protein [Rhizobium sp. AN80A]|nr:hypothetical protein [Rhizobium sp. AN80A]
MPFEKAADDTLPRHVRTHTPQNPAEYEKRAAGSWLPARELPVPAIYR